MGENIVCLVLFFSIITFSFFKADMGIISSKKIIKKTLSATKETKHFNIHYPPDGAIALQMDFIAAEHEFRYHQITSELKIDYSEKIDSYIYLTDRQKKFLQGAGKTMYADVSNSAIHMSYRPFPHRVLKHELTHIVTSVWGMPYFGWSINVGLTEGLAVTREGYRKDGAIHGWAAAMKRLEKLPDIVDIMGPVGFWTKTGSRAYLAAGSFSLWLIETQGLEKYKNAYKWGQIESTYGAGLDELGDDWLAFLDGVEVSETLMSQARHRFTRRSLFEQKCVRVVERLLELGEKENSKGRFHKGIKLFSKAEEFAFTNPYVSMGLLNSYMGAGYFDKAYSVANEIVNSQGGQDVLNPDYIGSFSPLPVIKAMNEMALIDWRKGNMSQAKEFFEKILNSNYRDDYSRFAHCCITALEDPEIEPFIREYFASDSLKTARIYYLTRAVQLYPEKVIPRYLLAIRLFNDREYFSATSHFLQVLGNKDINPLIRRKTLNQLARSLFFQKRFDESIIIFHILQKEQLTVGGEMNVMDWIERGQFTKKFFKEKQN